MISNIINPTNTVKDLFKCFLALKVSWRANWKAIREEYGECRGQFWALKPSPGRTSGNDAGSGQGMSGGGEAHRGVTEKDNRTVWGHRLGSQRIEVALSLGQASCLCHNALSPCLFPCSQNESRKDGASED
jgi:hypothetical protein